MSTTNRKSDVDAPFGEADIYSVTIDLRVLDAGKLYDAAATLLRGRGVLDQEDIEETIGPRCDPSIEDCLATLCHPGVVAGCTAEAFDVAHSRPKVAARKISSCSQHDRNDGDTCNSAAA